MSDVFAARVRGMRKTKIIATLGPATESPEMLEKLILAGVNIFRLNMSHAPHDWVRQVTKDVRAVAKKLNRHIGLLLDTQGPAIRTGDMPAKLDLKPGDVFTFTVRGERSEELYSVDTNYDDLVNDINVGEIVLVDNGVIRMKVLAKEEKKLRCEVLTPGVLGNRRHINLPGVKVNLPALTAKDLEDLWVGIECGVDYVALSFVREANDIALLRQILVEKGSEAKVIAKIEDQTAIRNLDEIIFDADAVMVARGDLGIECPYEELPIIQRRIVKTCMRRGKPVIVATHMLESMITNPSPTRAEITDVANAVFEQADAIMLSGETTIGKYPEECVVVMDRVAERIERSGGAGFGEVLRFDEDKHRVAAAAVRLADDARVDGIMVFTRRGVMGGAAAAMRPRFSPIYAFAPTDAVCGRMTLNFATIPLQVDFSEDPEDTIVAAIEKMKRLGYTSTGDRLVVVSDLKQSGQMVNSVQLRVVH
jgi:pyruvate kinase